MLCPTYAIQINQRFVLFSEKQHRNYFLFVSIKRQRAPIYLLPRHKRVETFSGELPVRSDDSFSKSVVLGGKLNFKPHLEENMNLFSKLHPQFE